MPGARTRFGFAIALLAVLIVSVGVWLFFRSGKLTSDLPSAPARPDLPNPERGLQPTDRTEVGLPTERTTVLKTESTAKTDEGAASAPGQARIFGSLVDTAGEPIKGTWWAAVSLTDASGKRIVCDAKETGTYEFSDLVYGTYWASAGVDGYRKVDETIELRLECPELRKDFVMRRASEVPVRVNTPEGRYLFDVLTEMRAPTSVRYLIPVATREAPGKRFDGVVGSLNNKFGVGHLSNYGPRVKALAPGYMGILTLDCDPPLYVSLVHYQVVLRTERVDPGQDEVTFVISPKELLANLATVRVRVIDAQNSLPIARAKVSFQGGTGAESLSTDGEGVATLERSEPGSLRARITAEGYEKYAGVVDALPGLVTDLGTIALEREIIVKGRVLGAEGNPSAASFDLGILDAERKSICWLEDERVSSGPDGAFQIRGLGRREYVIHTSNLDGISHVDQPKIVTWVSGNVLVDTRGAVIPELEVRLHPASRLALSAANAAVEGLKFRIVDGRGLEVLRSSLWESRPRLLLLPQDGYKLSLLDPLGNLLAEHSVTLGPEKIELDLARQ